jgi:hypothetical protein
VTLQIILLVYTQFASTIYVYKYKPFIGKLQLYTELVNEITIFVATESMLFYTNILLPDIQNRVGWISFTLFVMQVLINVNKMVILTTQRVILWIKKYYKVGKQMFK